MEEDNIGISVEVGNTELGKSGELIKNIRIDINKPLTSNVDSVIVGINVEGYTINVISLLENIAHIEELKGAIVVYDKD